MQMVYFQSYFFRMLNCYGKQMHSVILAYYTKFMLHNIIIQASIFSTSLLCMRNSYILHKNKQKLEMQHRTSLQFTPNSMLFEVFPATLRALQVSHPESLPLALRMIKSSVLPPSRDVTLNGDVRCCVSHETVGIGSPLPLQVMTN